MFPNALQEIEKVNSRKIFHQPKDRHDSGFPSPGYRLPLVTRILVSGWSPVPLVTRILGSGWLPITTGNQNSQTHAEFQTQSGSRLPLITIISVSD